MDQVYTIKQLHNTQFDHYSSGEHNPYTHTIVGFIILFKVLTHIMSPLRLHLGIVMDGLISNRSVFNLMILHLRFGLCSNQQRLGTYTQCKYQHSPRTLKPMQISMYLPKQVT